MRTLLWIAVLIFAAQLGFELLDYLRADDAPWWMDLLASLAFGAALSYFVGQAFGRYLPSGASSRLFRRAQVQVDDRANRAEPITPRMFSSPRRDPDLPRS